MPKKRQGGKKLQLIDFLNILIAQNILVRKNIPKYPSKLKHPHIKGSWQFAPVSNNQQQQMAKVL